MVKDLKRSIRERYNRRKKHLSNALEQFVTLAEERLDETQAGRIQKKEKTQKLLEMASLLKDELDVDVDVDVDVDFSDIPNLTNIEDIIEEGKKWMDTLSKEDWNAIAENSMNKDRND